MKINKVKLYNFSSYEGNNEFDFEITDAEKNIVLIGGKNGAGKTSLFTAIKVALYGPLAYGYVGVNSHYISKIKDLINSKAFQQEIVESEVQITLQLKIERDIRNYVITRKWDYTNQRLTEEYTVERDGKQLNDQELSYFENYLRSIIPPDLFEFFLFDGEEVGNIFSTSAYNTYVRNAVFTMCGMDVFEIIRKFTRGYVTRNNSTPYARIDANHRREISEKFFPNISDQVIILSTDEEINEEYYKIIKPYISKEYLLINDENENRTTNGSGLLEVDIEDDKDVYNQKNVFKTAYATIDAILSENDRFKEFKDKLQNSTLLVLIKDIDSTNSDAVEQIFLDINEKSKRLDNASIFKGYCFKIYDEAFQDELKCLWIRLKKAYISFKNFSGENYKFDEYIYMYLLVTEDENMTENLSPGGIHFLEDKNMDDVERILTKMVEYGERVSDFYKHIQNEAYIFEDICVDSNSYKTASKKLITNVKEYLLYSMETKSAQYQKVPLNWFIYSVKDKSNNMNILMKDFMTITANLYIYSFLFTLSPSKKSKKNIDHSLYNVLNEDVDIKQIINIVKELRKKQVENVQIPENCRSFDVLSNLYTIMDCFKVKENRFDVTYHNHGGQLYTLEHFIVPDNRNAKIKWLTKDEESIEISFTGQSERKKKLINYLIVEQKLNNDILLDFDVIKKIELISDYYGNATPKHVGIITAHIENMESYKELKKLKNEEDEKEVENIRNCYNSFLDEYFSDNNQRTILNKLLEGLKLTFINS